MPCSSAWTDSLILDTGLRNDLPSTQHRALHLEQPAQRSLAPIQRQVPIPQSVLLPFLQTVVAALDRTTLLLMGLTRQSTCIRTTLMDMAIMATATHTDTPIHHYRLLG